MPRPPSRGPKAKRPTPLLLKPIRVKDWPGLFGAAAKLAASGSRDDATGVLEGFLKLFASVRLGDDPRERAWVCVQRALLMSFRGLVAWVEVALPDTVHRALSSAPKAGEFDAKLSALDITLDTDFFDRPVNARYVQHVGRMLRSWAVGAGVHDEVADELVGHFYQLFSGNLEREWGRHEEELKPLRPENRRTTFTPAAEAEYAWAVYAQWLFEQSDRLLFEEDFSVRDLYVPLRAYTDRVDGASIRRTIGMATDMLDAWLEAGRADDDVRVIEGDPGAGKSTLARIFAADRFGRTFGGRRWRVVFAPLHDQAFEQERPLAAAIADYCQSVCKPLKTPLDREAVEPTLLILDGLDELSRGGQIGVDLIRTFMNGVRDLKHEWNKDQNRARLLILVCGRPIAADIARRVIGRTDAVLNLLPFVTSEDEMRRLPAEKPVVLDGRTELLKDDQRANWWGLYADKKPGTDGAAVFKQIRKATALTSVTAQPLLNYLVALVRERKPGKALPENRFDLYERLVHDVWERRWGPNRKKAAGELTHPEFVSLLQALAVAAWHEGNIREIRLAAVQARLTADQLALLQTLAEDSGKGLLRIMLAFFTRPRGTVRGDEVYEFTHKSFAEFLVARRVVDELEALADGYLKPDLKRFWNAEQRLVDWVTLCGPSRIDKDIEEFISDAAQLRGADRAHNWLEMLARLLSAVVRDGMPMHKMLDLIQPRATFRVMNDWALQGETAMLSVSSLSAIVSGTRVRVEGLEEVLPEWVGSRWAEALRSQQLNWANLKNIEISTADLSEANLSGADLSEANLSGANLPGANLSRASLSRANLSETNLSRASLSRASLSGVSLSRANLSGADLFQANLSRANLSGANLFQANLSRANLSGANLSGANLFQANLSETNLSETNLSEANLSEADLPGADFTNVRGVDIAQLAERTNGEPAIMPDGKPPAKDWRKKASPTKRKPHKPRASPSLPPEPPPAPAGP